jgi:glutathione S-transferase
MMAGVGRRGTLYGVSLSPFVRKVRAVLTIKSVDYDLVNIMPGAMDAEFLAKSPLSKIPVWEEDGWTLPDSSAICAYLERVEPTPPLYPSDPREFATALFWEEYADTRIVDSCTPIFFQRVVQGRFFKQPPDEEIVRRHIDEVLPPVFDQIEELFIEAVLGNAIEKAIDTDETHSNPEITIATLSVWSPLVNLDHAGYELDAKGWPRLTAFMEAMGGHPVLRALIEEERAAMPAK